MAPDVVSVTVYNYNKYLYINLLILTLRYLLILTFFLNFRFFSTSLCCGGDISNLVGQEKETLMKCANGMGTNKSRQLPRDCYSFFLLQDVLLYQLTPV